MGVLYVVTPGARVSTEGGRLRVLGRDGARLADAPLGHVEALGLFPGADATRGALEALARRGAPTLLLDGRGRCVATLAPTLDGAAPLRLAQAALALDPDRRLEAARALVRAKRLVEPTAFRNTRSATPPGSDSRAPLLPGSSTPRYPL